jgi:hypothetical protein
MAVNSVRSSEFCCVFRAAESLCYFVRPSTVFSYKSGLSASAHHYRSFITLSSFFLLIVSLCSCCCSCFFLRCSRSLFFCFNFCCSYFSSVLAVYQFFCGCPVCAPLSCSLVVVGCFSVIPVAFCFSPEHRVPPSIVNTECLWPCEFPYQSFWA